MLMTFDPNNYIKADSKINKLREGGEDPKKILSKQLKDRGFTDKLSKNSIQAAVFVEYAMTRIAVYQKEEDLWFYNFKSNQYNCLSDSRIRKIFFHIFCEADKNLWNASIEKQYIDYFRRCVSEFTVSGYEPGFLQFTNGILDFSEDDFYFADSSPDYFCQFRVPYAFDENANCPQFMKFLNDIFEKDQERIDLIQEIMGACLLYDDCMQKLVIFLGKGSNGKSLLASVIKNTLGKNNVSAIALDKLSGDRFAKQNLDNKLLNISSETNPEKIYTTSDIKILTGGDSVEIEKKFCDSYTTEIHSKFILLANEMIQTADYSDGFYRRLMIIPFNKQYLDLAPGKKKEKGKAYKDIYLESKLMEELPGIFNFALDGFIRLQAANYNFTESKACNKAIERFKNQHNVVRTFIKEKFDITGNDSDKVRASKLFPEFEKFCRDNHYYRQYRQISKTKFIDMFKEVIEQDDLLVNNKKTNGIYYYTGIKIK